MKDKLISRSERLGLINQSCMALQLMAINGCIDRFISDIMWMEAHYINSDPKVIGLLHKHSDTHRGCPQQV